MTIYHVLSIYNWVHLLNGENISLLMGTTLKFWMEESFNNKTTEFQTRVNVNISIKSWNNNNENCVKEKGGWFFICSCSWLSKCLMSREREQHSCKTKFFKYVRIILLYFFHLSGMIHFNPRITQGVYVFMTVFIEISWIIYLKLFAQTSSNIVILVMKVNFEPPCTTF